MKNIFFDGEQIAKWRETYPGVNILAELAKMTAWLTANPRRAKKNYHRFAVNWLTRAHNRLLDIETRETIQHQLRKSEARNY